MAVEVSHLEAEARLLEQALGASASVLEAGCGRTTRLAAHRDRISRLVGVDIDAAAGRENEALDEFIATDLCRGLPFEDGSFDLVYSNFVVEHLPSPSAAFREWRRVLRPTGSLVLLTTNAANPAMWAARRIPQPARLAAKRLAGEEERDVFPALYRANTPRLLSTLLSEAGFAPVIVHRVSILHRYLARWPWLQGPARAAERRLPAERRSTIVAWYRAR